VTDDLKQGVAEPVSSAPRLKTKRRVANLGCVLGLFMGLAGIALSRLGQLWIAFDVFSQFTLHFLIIALAFTVGLFMPRAKILTACVFCISLILALSVWPQYTSRHISVLDKVKGNETALRVASFNMWYENQKTDEIIAEISRIDADVIALVEIGPSTVKIFDPLKAKYPFQVSCYNQQNCDLAILSKHPLYNFQAKWAWAGPEYIRASLGSDFGGFTVFGVHTTRFPRSGPQFKQIKALARDLEKVAGDYVVMGDFNATPFSRVTQTLATEANLTRLTNLPSWPARLGLPQIAIDHIFVSKGIRQLESQSIGNNVGSDHFPIFMKLAVPTR
jgi:endonuclease/exonuclease/phosphatase (EEP) superfamily protein YafD